MFRNAVLAVMIAFGVTTASAGASAISDEEDVILAQQWTREHGIASIPISVFYQQAPEQHYLRFCFAKSDEVLLQAAEILCRI